MRCKGGWDAEEYRAELGATIEMHGGWEESQKPSRPKEVFLDILRRHRVPQSSSLYGQLAERESLKGCVVESFCRFVGTLQSWFPES